MPKRSKTGQYQAPAAGAFGGIATLGFGQHVPDTYPLLKSIIIYGSPAISLFYASAVQVGFVWLIATAKRRDMKKALRGVRSIRDEARASNLSSPDHLNDLQKSVERTEKLASEMATASNVKVVEMFEGISISDLTRVATAAVQAGAEGLGAHLDAAPHPQKDDARQRQVTADEPPDPEKSPPSLAERPSRTTTPKPRNSVMQKVLATKPVGKKPANRTPPRTNHT